MRMNAIKINVMKYILSVALLMTMVSATAPPSFGYSVLTH
jgi:hypothetical protein